DTLVSALMTALPDHAASPLMTRLQDELRTESVRSQAREQFTGAVDRIFDTAESVCIASVARTVLRASVTRWSLLPALYGTGFSSEQSARGNA
ncbi:GTP-binding protein, partial [Escherichia coli]